MTGNADENKAVSDLDEAIRHCRAGLKALEAVRAQAAAAPGAPLYPVYINLAAVELADAIRIAVKVAMREG